MSEVFAMLSGRRALQGDCPATPVVQDAGTQNLLARALLDLCRCSAADREPSQHNIAWPDGRLQLWTAAECFRQGDNVAVLLGTLFQRPRLALELGLSVGSTGNAELLFHASRRFGDNLVEYLTGEFAFLLWDGERRRLLVGRDSSGSYPLYFQHLPDGFALSSDISLTAVATGQPLRVSERRVAQWLALVPPDPGATFFQEIDSVPAGSLLEYREGRLVALRTWNPLALPLLHLKDSREYEDRLRAVLDEAVQDRLREDEHAATSLSGGLDSSSITALAAAARGPGGRGMEAYTAVPGMTPAGARGYFADEWSRAAGVAAMYPNVEHVAILHGRHAALDLVDRFNVAEMQPIFNPANYDWLYELCLCAGQRGSRSVLMGLAGNLTISYDGGGALSGLVREGRIGSAMRLGAQMHTEGRGWKAVAHQLLRPALPLGVRRGMDALRGADNRVDQYSLMRRMFAADQGMNRNPRANDLDDPRALRLRSLQRIDPAPTLHAMRRLTGIHISDPTNDRRVVEFCLAVPETEFCHNGVPRSLIRNAMRGLLPESVRNERMRGLQAADFGMRFQAEIPRALREVREMQDVELAGRCLNLPQMRVLLAQGMRQTTSASQVRFWPRLMRAIALGRFLQAHQQDSSGISSAAAAPTEQAAPARHPVLSPWGRGSVGNPSY